jgi:hypothetical protein
MRPRQADGESGAIDRNFAFTATFLANLAIVKTRITLIIGTRGTPT